MLPGRSGQVNRRRKAGVPVVESRPMSDSHTQGSRSWVSRRIQRARGFLESTLWEVSLDDLSRWRRGLYRSLRVGFLVTRGFFKDRCQFLAFALTYMTLLSIVPLLALAFALAKGLKAQDALRPIIENQFGEGMAVMPSSA